MTTQRVATIALLAPILALSGCGDIFGLDNYDAPSAKLSGRVVYQGEPVNVRTNGVQMELWEPGFDLLQKIPIYVDQDGSFTATLFNGQYKLITLGGNGPWMDSTDTLVINLDGEATVDFPVTPYFVVQNPQISYNASVGAGGTVTANFSIGSIAPSASRNLEWAGVYVATTAFVDRTNRVVQLERSRAQLGATWNSAPVTLSVALPANIRVTPSPAVRDHVYVRVGVKTTGVAEMIFSPLLKLTI